jgi:arylsulfatase A-like enzyme
MTDFQSSGKMAAGLMFALISTSCIGGNTIGIKKQDRPNIIFIMSDDHAYQAISAYNPDLIKTPNIDRIAKEGVLLNQAFVTNSICGPSRAVILTGKYSHMNGFERNTDNFNGDQQTLPKILKRNGYKTAIVGKWHLKSDPQGFDYWNILPGQGSYYNPDFIKMGKDTVYKGYVTNITTDLALNWIGKNKEAPFFLMLHNKAPHRNQMPPLENLELFNDREFPFPSTFFDNYEGRLALQQQGIRMDGNLYIDQDSKVPCDTCPPDEKWKPKAYQNEMKRMSPDEKKIWSKAYQKEYEEYARIKTRKELVRWQYQRYMEDYLRCIRSVDDNVGRVLKYLEDAGMAENTIVVYTSDQGVFLGEHGLYDKRFMYKESFRTPMMVRYPEQIKQKQSVDNYVLNLDIAPTLLDFAGVAIPEDMQGISMKKLLLGEKVVNWRDKIYYHYYEKNYGMTAHYGIQTSRFKLMHFYDPIDTWELFDLQNDPNEMDNLYEKTEYVDLIISLKTELKDLKRKYNDEI